MKKKSKHTYNAWNIKEEDFPQNGPLESQLRFLLGYAILAPSTHNTQPWRFSIEGNRVDFLLDPSRILPASDPEGREAYISLGHALENFLIALEAHGLRGAVTHALQLPEYPHRMAEPFVVCSVSITSDECSPSQEAAGLCSSIKHRRSARAAYHDTKLHEEIKQICSGHCARHQEAGYLFVEDEQKKSLIADAVADGTAHAFNNPEFGKELSQWIIPNWKTHAVGMPGFTVGMPGPISYIVPKLLARINLGRMQAKQMGTLVQKTPTLCVVHAPDDTHRSWLAAGRLSERLCVSLAHHHFCTSIMAAPVEFNHIAARLAQGLGLVGRPLVFFRIGQTSKTIPYSPRLSVDECLVKGGVPASSAEEYPLYER